MLIFKILFVHVPFPWAESLVVFPGLVSYDSEIEAYMRSAGRKRKKERKEGGKEKGKEEGRKEGRTAAETMILRLASLLELS